MDKIKHILTIICLTLSLNRINAQQPTPVSIGTGINSSIYFSTPFYSVPSLPISPYLNIKIKRHEFLAGVDLYPFPLENGNVIVGGQAAYRYHFIKENKPLHLFIDCNFQYVAFQSGCGGPLPYDNTNPKYFCFDGAVFKDKSFVNTFGVGGQINFLKRFSFYAIVGGGYNYYENKIYKNWTGYEIKDGYYTFFTANIRAGLSFDIYQKK